MAINLNSNISILAPFNLDAKYGVWSGADIATAKTNALNGIPSIYRAIGLTVGLFVGGNTTEYWFKSGTADVDLVEKTSGSTISSGNLITVASGGQIDFTGGTNTQEVIVENSSAFPFIFTADDDVDNLTFQGNANNGNIRLSFNTFDVGQVYFNFGTSPQVDFTSTTANSGSVNFNFEDSNSFFQTNSMNVNFDISPNQSVTLNGTDDGGGGSEVNLNLYPATSSNGSFINFSQTDLHFAFFDFGTSTRTEVARFIGNSTANFLVYNNMTVGANTAPSGAVLDVHQTGNAKANIRLTGVTTGDKAILQFLPFVGSDSVIDYADNGRLFIQANGTAVAQFNNSTSANFIVYNNSTIGRNHNPTEAKLEIYQTGNSIPNLKLFGLNSSDNAILDFAPANGIDAYINNSTNTKIFFWTNGSGTSYYDASLFYFGSNRVQIDNTLESNQSSLQIDPTYNSTGNSAITISGSSIRATTRGINIIHSYTGATSNAIYVGSAISASANLANAVNYNPTLTATANNDYLISLDVNPTLVSGAFTGVQNTAIRTISGSNLFNTLSGNTIIGSGADSGAFKLDVYGASRVVLNSNTTGAIATVTGVDLTYGLRVNLERSASSKSQYGIYTRLQGGASSINYGVYGESVGGNLGYGGYFVGNGNNSANRSFVGVLGEATNYNGTTTASGVGGFFQVAQTITSGTSIPIIGNVTNDTAPTGTLKYLDLRLAGTSQFFVERNANRNRPAMMIGGTTIDNSAIIQADSTTQGFLPPRMTGAQGTAIASPATGLIIYATSANGAITTAGWWGYNGATWVQLG
jgi:hypothetical protein